MGSLELNELRSRLHESKLRLDFAYNFLREVGTDGVIGTDHDEALRAALRAISEALHEYVRVQELFTGAVHKESALRKMTQGSAD